MAAPPSLFRRVDDGREDARAASLEIGAHVALLQGREIAARGAQRNRLAGVEAMAARHAPGGDAEDLARHDGVAVQHDDPVHGPHELSLAVAPAHAPRDRQRVERRLDDARQELGGGLARPRGPAEQELAPVVADARELVDLDAAGLGEGARGARRLAGGIEGGGHRRAASLDALLRLPIEELVHDHREAARRELGLRSRRARGPRPPGRRRCRRGKPRRARGGSWAASPLRRSRPGSRGGSSWPLLHADGARRQGQSPFRQSAKR